MASHHPIRKTVKPSRSPEIPDKLYFRIGDVSKLCDVPAYVLRFWETEFPQLKPNKGGTGQRLYRRKDVETALRIKSLLYDQGYTIPGARQVLRDEVGAKAGTTAEAAMPSDGSNAAVASKEVEGAPSDSRLQPLHALRDELRSLSAQLNRPVGASTPATAVRSSARIKPATPQPEAADIHLNQRDLFSAE